MARPFRRTPGGYTASFEPAERDLIRELAEDVRALLRPADTTADGGTVDPLEALVGITENPTIPADSAVARLLPAASSDDEVATEYRRYTERDLRETKRANLAMLAFDIESSDLRLNEEHARAWAAALGDIRLVLADRLYIVDEDTAEDIAAFTDPSEIETQEEYMAVVYNFVSWVQDSLMLAMLDGLDDEEGEEPGGAPGGANGGADEQE